MLLHFPTSVNILGTGVYFLSSLLIYPQALLSHFFFVIISVNLNDPKLVCSCERVSYVSKMCTCVYLVFHTRKDYVGKMCLCIFSFSHKGYVGKMCKCVYFLFMFYVFHTRKDYVGKMCTCVYLVFRTKGYIGKMCTCVYLVERERERE